MRATKLMALIATAVVVASCGGGSSSSRTSTPSASRVPATPVTASDWKTPAQLPVTPVALTFKPVDPKLDALPGARTIVGENGGATYNIEVPDNWNGEVLYFAHGFRGNVAELTVQVPPIRNY